MGPGKWHVCQALYGWTKAQAITLSDVEYVMGVI